MQNILKRLFKNEVNTRPLQLGRFTDHYKEKSKLTDWDYALELFSSGNFFGSVLKFLSYLNIDEQDNVIITENSSTKIRFKMFQGSKCVNGFANEDGFFAEVKLAHCSFAEKELLSLLLEKNYELQYSSFAMDSDENICMIFYSDAESASPYKLYYGLKELATTSDKNDDVLIKKYEGIDAINDGHILHLSEEEKNFRYSYVKKKIEKVLSLMEKYSSQLGGQLALKSYIIQSTVLTIDFLIKPEGLLMEEIESIYSLSTTTNKIKYEPQIEMMEARLNKLRLISKEDVFDELYEFKSTFGNLNTCSHHKVIEIIQQEMSHYDWYFEHGFEEVVTYIPLFISSSLLYNYALPLPDKLYLEFLLRLLENEFFVGHNYVSLIESNNMLNKKKILMELSEIEKKCKPLFEKAIMDVSILKFENIHLFCKSFLNGVIKLNPIRI